MTIGARGVKSLPKSSSTNMKGCSRSSKRRSGSTATLDTANTGLSFDNEKGMSSEVVGDKSDSRSAFVEFDQRYLRYLSRGDTRTLIIATEPASPHCITLRPAIASLKRKRQEKCVRHYGSISVRDSFLHCTMDDDYRLRCKVTVEELIKSGINEEDLFLLYPKIPRYVLYNYRKHQDKYLESTVEHCLEIIRWYNSNYFPIKDTEPELRKMLDQGLAYWIGRDKNHRPILVLRFTSDYLCPVLFERTVTFCVEWAKHYLFIPTVCETAVIWIDLTRANLTKIPYSEVQSICSKLTFRYPFQLDHFYILHDSVFIQTCTPIIRTFMTELQRLKIKMHRKTIPIKDIDLYYNSGIVDERFGGSRKAIDTFYPFPVLSNDIYDALFMKVWDVACLHGYPEIEKSMPICLNTSEIKNLLMKLNLKYNFNNAVTSFESKVISYSSILLKERILFVEEYKDIPNEKKLDLGNFSQLSSIEHSSEMTVVDDHQAQSQLSRRVIPVVIQDGESPLYTKSRTNSSNNSWLCPVPCLAFTSEKSNERLTVAEFQMKIERGADNQDDSTILGMEKNRNRKRKH